MSFVDDLRAGTYGLSVTPPASWQLLEEKPNNASFRDGERPIAWFLFFFPGFQLVLDPFEALERDVERHTRLLFDTMFGMANKEGEPRTRDASWSPLVEIERMGDALYVLHRMTYQPGNELIMGHYLVSTADGLFEARWGAKAQMTGLREALFVDRLLREGKMPPHPQALYDDPAYDAQFPDHPLSLARSVKHTFRDVRVERPPPPFDPDAEIAGTGCAVTVPPRFALGRMKKGNVPGAFYRVSFSGTDGLERLLVMRSDERFRGIAVSSRLAKFAESRTRTSTGTCARVASDRDVVFVTEQPGAAVGDGRTRAVFHWFVDDLGHAWAVVLTSTIAVSVDDLAREAAAVRASFRRLG